MRTAANFNGYSMYHLHKLPATKVFFIGYMDLFQT